MCIQNRAHGEFVPMKHKDIISFYRRHKRKFADRIFLGVQVGTQKTLENYFDKESRQHGDGPPARNFRGEDKIPNYFVNKYPMIDMNWWDTVVLKNLNF